MYIGEKKKNLNISQEKGDQNKRKRKRMYVTLSFDQILNIYDVPDEHCSGVYTYSLSFSVVIIIIIVIIEMVQRERCKLYA
jgi:hypothetical protein